MLSVFGTSNYRLFVILLATHGLVFPLFSQQFISKCNPKNRDRGKSARGPVLGHGMMRTRKKVREENTGDQILKVRIRFGYYTGAVYTFTEPRIRPSKMSNDI